MNDGEAGTSRGAVVTEDYDVFLNHRGPDVKANFVAHLEEALRCAGHRPFLDARSLMKGNPALQSIDDALAMANVHVAVVSRGYAESMYCLNELVAMLKSCKPVVPVFYGVEPGDLRWVENENGPFAAAFKKHHIRGRSPEKVQEWRDALAALAEITGFRLADYRSDESKLKQEVVKQVARLTPSNICVEVDFCRVGLEGPTHECIEVMEKMDDGIGILGIVGMGGIGKSTLAREIYNHYARERKFKHMSFLEIHQESIPSSSNVQGWLAWSLPLRKQLMWDILRVDSSGSTDYTNWFQGIKSVGPVMIVVDNVYDPKQLHGLRPFLACLYRGSCMMVTSRDRSILNNMGGGEVKYSTYDIPLLNTCYASKLFNWHAFHSMEAEKDLEGFAKNIVEACGGLPLALKVIGASLFNKRMGEDREALWMEARDVIVRSRDVMDVLRWSYDILVDEDKRMFVDIACLFNNETREEALAYWRSCKDCVSCDGMGTPYTSLQNLIDANLVSCPSNHRLRVHDLLVELGEEIGKTAQTHYTKRNNGEVALRRKEGLTKTLALNLRESKKRRFGVEEFAHMPNLHFLELPKKAKINGDWSCMPRELRWLRWCNSPLKQVPPQFDMSKLTLLDFSESSKLVELWTNSKCSLKGCPNLVRLNLNWCSSIKELHDSIGECSELQYLDLWGCENLKKLPDTVGQLKQLQSLSLPGCKRLKTLPESIGLALKLQVLRLGGCERLQRLPESIGLLKELTHLDLDYCRRLKSLPRSIGELSQLIELNADGCTSLGSVPPSLLHCSSLISLRLEMDPCLDLQTCFVDSIQEAWTSLNTLTLKNARGLLSYLPYGAFESLTTLNVMDKTLTEFPESIGLLEALQWFYIECEVLECLPNSLGDLEELMELSLSGCENLKRLPETLGDLTNLINLTIHDCSLLRKLPSSIGMLSGLGTFDLQMCPKLKNLPTSFQQLDLVNFTLAHCENIEAVEVLTTLQGMSIWRSKFITELPPSPGVLLNLYIESFASKDEMEDIYGLIETDQVLEESETSILLANKDKSTGLLSLEVYFYD